MKLCFKALALSIGTVLLSATFFLYAHATEDEIKPTRIAIYYNNRNVSSSSAGRVTIYRDKEKSLDYRIYPDDANTSTDVTWRSSNTDVADVDSSGTVTANDYGECTIRVRTENGKSASCTIYVPGGSSRSYDEYISSGYSSSGSSAAAKQTDKVTLNGSVPREILMNAVRISDGKTSTLNNYESISADSLHAAAEIGNPKLNFDTYLGDTLIGRITLVPKSAQGVTGTIKLGVYSGTASTQKVQNTFNKYYTNSSVVILCDQGNFPFPVDISAKTGSLKVGDLHFYKYDAANNKVSGLNVSNVNTSSNSFVRFTTSAGGYIVISDGKLVRKPA